MVHIKDIVYKSEVTEKFKDKDWNDPEVRKEILSYFDKCTEEGWQTGWNAAYITIDPEKMIFDDISSENNATIFNDFISKMKECGKTTAVIYKYDRDNDGDMFEHDMRDLWNEYFWDPDCLNGCNVNGIYADDVNKVWDKVIENEIWKDPDINKGTTGIYDDTVISAGHTLSIIINIAGDDSVSIIEKFGLH